MNTNKDKQIHLEFLDKFYTEKTTNMVEWNKEKVSSDLTSLLTLVKCKTGRFRSKMKEGLNGINDISVNILATALSNFGVSFIIGFDY